MDKIVYLILGCICLSISLIILSKRYKYFSKGQKVDGVVERWEIGHSKSRSYLFSVILYVAYDGQTYRTKNYATVSPKDERPTTYPVYYLNDTPSEGLVYDGFSYWWQGIMPLIPAVILLYGGFSN
jgi:hypothetical protein